MDARTTALSALIAMRREKAWSNGVLKKYVARDRLNEKDGALAVRLTYGVVQNRLLLDWYLKQLLTGSLNRLHPAARDILHLGLYQILFLDKIPASAAVNEAVSQAKKYCPSAAGLINAVLRKASVSQLQPPKGYAELYSHPQELVDLLQDNIGKKNLGIMLKADNEIVNTVIQVNTLKTSAEALAAKLKQQGITMKPHGCIPKCYLLSGTGDLEKLQCFREGDFYVQDGAARLSVSCAQLKPGMTVLDACAAPGGKSFSAMMDMEGQGHIVSCDIHPHKVKLIENGYARLGISNIEPRLQDATADVPEWHNKMDAVIADVPCSGYGIIRKKPDIRYKNPEDMAELPVLQSKVLETQSAYVKPGGLLMYSTCTVLHRENREVVRRFLDGHPEFCAESLPLPAGMEEDAPGMLTLIPGKYDTDGFFVCRLRRKA